MKRFICLMLSLAAIQLSFTQVAVNTNSTLPHASAMLDITSINKGLLIPRMSTVQRTAIASPAKGLLVFTNDDNSFWFYDGTQWIDLISASSNLWKRTGNAIYNSGFGDVLIGTSTPEPYTILNVAAGSNEGILVTGSESGFNTVPDFDAGNRLMFYPGKGVFRAGKVSGNRWNDENVGFYSFASGYNTQASGERSTAMGNSNKATGYSSTALGLFTHAKGHSNTVVGVYNDTAANWFDNVLQGISPVFVVGNGLSESIRSNAIVVQQNGNVMIGDSVSHSSAQLHVELKNSTSKGFLVNGNFNSSASVPNLGAGSRMMYYPGKAAFRAGYVTSNQWNNSEVGKYSVAMGYNTTASGENAASFGDGTIASGDHATALGYSGTSEGFASLATGILTKASGVASSALGYGSYSGGIYSTSTGYYTIAKGYSATVVGMYNDSILLTNQPSPTSATPLFIVGNGDGAANGQRSNAMVVYKNGDTELDNLKTLKVGNGTTISKLQAGETNAGSNPGASGFKRYVLTFPAAFTTTPKIIATAKNDPGWSNVDDTFVVSVRNISTTQVEFNIQRVDTNTGWNQNLRIEWQAWE